MKKLLISVLIVLLVVLAYFAMFQGISLGNIRVLSVKQIMEANEDLTNKIEVTTSLIKKEYPSKKETLSTEITQLLEKKEEYFDIAKISTEGEISKANTEETYLIEYLWARVGRHATSKGVKMKMDVYAGDMGDASIKNLAFTCEGNYVAVINFVSALEDDSELNFKIENFKLVPNTTNLTATFNVRNIRIKTENVTSNVSTTSNAKNETTNNTVDTNTTNETSQNTTANETANNTAS